VIRLAWSGLRARRIPTAIVGLGLLTATLGFVVLAGTSRTTSAVLLGDIAAAWDTPYDLLIRPRGSVTGLEAAEGLVRPNFIAGTPGGISAPELDAVRATDGVAIAAPVAVVGFVSWPAGIPVDLSNEVQNPASILRVSVTASGEGNFSTFPSTVAGYLAYASDGQVSASRTGPSVLETEDGKLNCDTSPPLYCFGGATPGAFSVRGLAPGVPGAFVPFDQPIVIAGIDPVAESELLGLDACVVDGRYLDEKDQPRIEDGQPQIPVLASRTSFIDESLRIDVDRSDQWDTLLALGPGDLSDWARVDTRSANAAQAYEAFLPTLADGSFYDSSPVWSMGDVSFREVGPDHLAAQIVQPDLSIYQTPVVSMTVPPEATDVWLRSVRRHDQVRRSELFSRWRLVGQYDPACIPGFDPLAGGRLETYSLPAVNLPGGGILGPTRSPGSYVASPPLVLTTLDGAAWFADPARYQGAAGGAFISAIRVRVAGTENPGPVSEARLARVAAAIRTATGLEVDIVKGSSPRSIAVDLPAGRYGRPMLTVTEGWSVKGVAIRFVEAVSSQDLLTFVLILLSAGLLVAQTAFLSVRERRAEFAVLRALGWPGWRIAMLVELELLMLGAVVGLVALGAGMLIAALSGVGVTVIQIVGAVPLAILVALVGGLAPALSATRGSPLRTLVPMGAGRLSGRFGSVVALGVWEVVRSRLVEAFIGAVAMAIASTLVGGLILVANGFAGQLDTTVLGTYLAFRVQGFHVILAALALVVGSLAGGVVVLLGYLERQPQLAALRALGWPARSVATVVVANAAIVGLLGATISVPAIWVLSRTLGADPRSTILAISGAIVALSASSLLAGAGPFVHAYRSNPARVLRGG
jgi:putative ABC transport system permease protein